MKKKRDILFLCQFFYPEYISSAQLPYDTVLALRDAGFSVGALCGYPREYAEGGKVPTKEDANGIRIHRLKYIQTGRSGFLGRIVTPEVPANLAWGDADWRTLYITARTSLYRIRLGVAGIPVGLAATRVPD